MPDVTCKRTKAAMIREEGHPVGQPAPLYLLCCGNKVPQAMPPLIAATVCPDCGTAYDDRGWIVGSA